MAKSKVEKQNPITRGINFFSDSWVEVKKVHPPTREETIQSTILVVIMIILFAAFLGFADFLVGTLIRQIIV